MIHDYAEELFKSIETIVEYYYQDQKFDETIICTIVDSSDCKNGHYIVSNGSVKFDAYSDVQDYKDNDSVRVTILKGDYSQKKYIVGKSVSENNEQPLTQTLETTILDITNNLAIDIADKQFALVANGDIQDQCIWSINLQDSDFYDIQNNNIYNSIILKADFKSLLSNYNIMSGSYGLHLDLYINTPGSENAYIRKRFWFDSADMFGDPYKFSIFSKQWAKFSLSESSTISVISLYFYQKNNFVYKGESGSYQQVSSKILAPNLLVSNIYVGIGTDLTTAEDSKLTIYTHNDLKYNIEDSNMSNEKQIGLIWYNQDDNHKYIGFSDGILGYDDSVQEIDKIIPYDEESYLTKTRHDTRLLAEQGKIEVPNNECGLAISADFSELKTILLKISDIIAKSLNSEFKDFKRRLNAIIADENVNKPNDNESITVLFNQLLDVENNFSLTQRSDQIAKNSSDLIDFYNNNLGYASVAQKINYLGDWSAYPSIMDPDSTKPYNWISIEKGQEQYEILMSELNNLIEDNYGINQFFINLYNIIEKKYSSFIGACDAYKTRIMRIVDELLKLIDNLIKYYNNNFNSNQDYSFNKLLNNLQQYVSPDFTIYDNRYCIYWYKYVDGFSNQDDPFGQDEWQRIPEAMNIGLPINKEGNGYDEKINSEHENGLLNLTLDSSVKEEKVKAILFFNHEKYDSNEIVFTNARPPVEEAIKNTIVIEHSTNSQSAFQLYGIDNSLINTLDFNKNRVVQLRHLNEFGNFDDEKLIGMYAYWYIPNNTTQLRYNSEDLKVFSNDLKSELFDTEFFKEGYTCFYTKITKDSESDVINGLSFTYRVKEYFAENNTQNTIYCIVSDGKLKFESSISFNFSTMGSNGTNYTLKISPQNDQTFIAPDNPFLFQIELFDYNNKRVVIGDKNPRISMITPFKNENSQLYLNDYSSQDEVVYGSTIEYSPCYYQVLQATVTLPWSKENDGTGKNITLTAYRVIPYASTTQYFIQGPSTVVYDSFGGNPLYFKDAFALYAYNIQSDGIVEVSENVEWDIQYYTVDEDIISKSSLGQYGIVGSYMPVLKEDNSLLPAAMYLIEDKQTLYPFVLCKHDGVVIWSQPIYLMQNRYPSAMLNNWDNTLTINQDNNTILTNFIGAGKKNLDNTFSGVLLGEIESKSAINTDGNINSSMSLASDHSGIGLYGFHENAQSFGFNVNGTAFLGKSSGGRIAFNGECGFIYSQNWLNSFAEKENPFIINNGTVTGLKPGTAGMAIDLQNGHIDAFNFKLTSQGIELNASPNENENYLFVGNNNSYLQYDKDGGLTIKTASFSLTSGVINNADFIGLYSVDQDNPISIGSSGALNSWRIIAGNSFGVTKNGNMYASAGNIAGWTIDSNKLSNSATNIITNKHQFTGYETREVCTAGVQRFTGNIDTRAAFIIEKTFQKRQKGSTNEKDWIDIPNSEANYEYPFYVRYNGTLHAENAEITGGNIGGWTINANTLKNSTNTVWLAPEGYSGKIFKVGNNFSVGTSGILTCSGANIAGSITADNLIANTGGSIAGWTINNNYLANSKDSPTVWLAPLGKSPGSTDPTQYTLYINNKFRVDTFGNFWGENCNIGGWDIIDNYSGSNALSDNAYHRDGVISRGPLLLAKHYTTEGKGTSFSGTYGSYTQTGTQYEIMLSSIGLMAIAYRMAEIDTSRVPKKVVKVDATPPYVTSSSKIITWSQI